MVDRGAGTGARDRAGSQAETPATLFSVRRSDQDTQTEYYFLYNQGSQPNIYNNEYEEREACRGSAAARCNGVGEPVDQWVTLEGKGAPYLLDAASGKITPSSNIPATGKGFACRSGLGGMSRC